jgi:hypothetical protein
VNVGAMSVRAEGAHVLRRLSSTRNPPYSATSTLRNLQFFTVLSLLPPLLPPSSSPSVFSPFCPQHHSVLSSTPSQHHSVLSSTPYQHHSVLSSTPYQHHSVLSSTPSSAQPTSSAPLRLSTTPSSALSVLSYIRPQPYLRPQLHPSSGLSVLSCFPLPVVHV